MRILTGDRPTGPLHIGHYVGSLQQRVAFQDQAEQFILIADAQALTDNFDNPQKVHDNIIEVALDYLAVGIDPTKSTMYIQSQLTECYELSTYFMNLVTVARLQRNPTVKEEVKQKGFGESLPVGFFVYPISQAADILAFKANKVPVGDDQLPMIEQAREIARKFNSIYGEVFPEPEAVLSEVTRLPGIDGNAKMSKSLSNGIYLKDSEDELKQKIMKMYTDPNHLRVEDPGQIEGNTVFTYLDAFHKNKEEVEELKEHYSRGGLGDVKVKMVLFDTMNELLTPIREKRQELAKHPEAAVEILRTGTQKAREVVAKTMTEVREVMKLNYFGS